MKSKSIKKKARGRKPTDKTKMVEKRLIKWCGEQWNKNKKLSRGIIFHQALLYDPKFCGGEIYYITFACVASSHKHTI
jgi:hypothetical protein